MNRSLGTHEVLIELNEPVDVVLERIRLSQRLSALFMTSFETRYKNLAKHYSNSQFFIFDIEVVDEDGRTELTPTIQVKFNTIDDTLYVTDLEFDKDSNCYVVTGTIKLVMADFTITFVLRPGVQEIIASTSLAG